MSDFIGAGERTAIKILKLLFPKATIHPQHRLLLLTNEDLSARQEKETIDIFVEGMPQLIAVRVHGKKGSGKLRAERHQRAILERQGIKVVDLHKKDCPELFKERFTVRSVWEVTGWLAEEGVNFEL